MDEKSKTELAVLQQLERFSKWQQLRDNGTTTLQVHQVGFAPYKVYRGVGAYDGIGELIAYDSIQPDTYGFPMLPSDFERLMPVLKALGISPTAWGGDVENIPSKHILSIADVRMWFANEGGGRRLAG